MVRGSAAALVCLLLAGEASSLLHSVMVAHATCPEHGEVVHVDGAGPAHVGDATSPSHAGFETGAAGLEAHAHEHCASLAYRQQGLRNLDVGQVLPGARLAV